MQGQITEKLFRKEVLSLTLKEMQDLHSKSKYGIFIRI